MSPHNALRHATAFALAVTTALSAHAAYAQGSGPSPKDTERAKAAFAEGVELEKRGECVQALARFREAAAIKATAGLRFHEAYCMETLGKLARAIELYETSATLAQEQGKTDVAAAVQARLEPLVARTPKLLLRVSPASGALRLDGTALPQGTKELRVDPGDHELLAQAPGYLDKRVHVASPEGSTVTVDLTLQPAAAPATPAESAASTGASEPSRETSPGSATSAPPAEPAARGSITAPLLTTLGAVALVGGGAAAFVLAGNAQTNGEALPRSDVAGRTDAQTEVRTLDALALGGIAGGVVLGTVAVVLWSSRSHSVTTTGTSFSLTGTF